MPVTLHGTYYILTEVAEILGYNTTSNLANACQAGKIPAVRVGKMWLIPETWLDEQKKIAPKGQGNRGVTRK